MIEVVIKSNNIEINDICTVNTYGEAYKYVEEFFDGVSDSEIENYHVYISSINNQRSTNNN